MARPTVLVLAALLAACSCPQNKVLIDDFESCTGACGWTITSGSANVVSTILPGEHGLKITGGATAVKAFPTASIDTSYSLQLVADCPAGLAASLAATVAGATSDVSLSVTLALDDSLDSSGNSPDYTGAAYVPLLGTITWPMNVTSAGVHQITLQPAGTDPCIVDVLRLTSSPPCSD